MEEKHLFNAVRFGLHYTGRVANPSDMVVFHKQQSMKVKTENKFDKDTLEGLFNVAGVSIANSRHYQHWQKNGCQ
jgi:hypothetical protein